MKIFLLVAFIYVSVAQAQSVVFNESFDAGIPLAWTIVDNDNNTVDSAVSEYSEAWIATNDPDDASNTVASTSSFFSPIDRADRWLITPGIDLGTYGNTISWRAKSHDPSYPEDYSVLISTTDTDLSSFTDTVALIENAAPYWIDSTVNLSALGYNGGTVFIAFVLTTFDGFKFYLDDVEINKEDPVALDSEEKNVSNLNVFPNPSSEFITISYFEKQQFTILDANARVVKTGETNKQTTIAELTKGVYFIRVLDKNNAIIQKKFIKL
ncbi:MAG: choice-of-anchor J domain-containing protein [Lishizhenia sp.]